MNTLILGASGLVGGNCMREFKAEGWNCLGTHFSFATEDTVFFNTLDLEASDTQAIDAFKPEVIVHCGALTWVDYCETNVEESHQKTVVSTLNAIALAKRYGAKLVYLSTDYVFDGRKGFYTEEDPVRPLSVYGRHKLEAEEAVRSSDVSHLICRITNVYGDEIRGKNFVSRLSENMRKGDPMELKLPYDQYATPVNAQDVAKAIFRLLSAGKEGLYHFASTDYLNRVQLAQRVMSYFGHANVHLIPTDTTTLNAAAERPLTGGMSAVKFNREFPDFRWSNVDDYLIQLQERTA
jgi:dTDP-4-dehydrorhamnose reductase